MRDQLEIGYSKNKGLLRIVFGEKFSDSKGLTNKSIIEIELGIL